MVNTLLSLNENTKIADFAVRCEKLHRSNELATCEQVLSDFLEESPENGEIRMSYIEILWFSGEKEAALTEIEKSLQLEAKQPKLLRFIFNALSGEDLSAVRWSFINFICRLAVLSNLEHGCVNQLLSRKLCLSLKDIANIVEESKNEYSNSIRGLQSAVKDVKEGFILPKYCAFEKNAVKHNIVMFKTRRIKYFNKLSQCPCILKNTHDLVMEIPPHNNENYKTRGDELKNRIFHENNSSSVEEVMRDCQFKDSHFKKSPKCADFGCMKTNKSYTHKDKLIPRYTDNYKTRTNKLKIKKNRNCNDPRVDKALQPFYFDDSRLEKISDISEINSTISTKTYCDDANLNYFKGKQENEFIPRYSYKTRGNKIKNKILSSGNQHNIEEALQNFNLDDSNLGKLPKIFDISKIYSTISTKTYRDDAKLSHVIRNQENELFPRYSQSYKSRGNKTKNKILRSGNGHNVKEALQHFHFSDPNLEKLPTIFDISETNSLISTKAYRDEANLSYATRKQENELIPRYSQSYNKNRGNKILRNSNGHDVEEALQNFHFDDSNLDKLPKIFDISEIKLTNSTKTHTTDANSSYVIRKQENEIIPRYSQSYKTRGNKMKNKIFRSGIDHNVKEALQSFHFNDSNLEKLPKIFDISEIDSKISTKPYRNDANLSYVQSKQENELIPRYSQSYKSRGNKIKNKIFRSGNNHNVEEALQHFHFDDSNLEKLPKIFEFSEIDSTISTKTHRNAANLSHVIRKQENEFIPRQCYKTREDKMKNKILRSGNDHNVEEALQHFHFNDSNLKKLPKIFEDVSAFNSTNSLEKYLVNENENNIPIHEDVNFNQLIPVNSIRVYHDDTDHGYNTGNESLDFVDSFRFSLNDRKSLIFTNVTRTTFRSVILSFEARDFKYYFNVKLPLSNVTESSPTDNSLALASHLDNNYNLRERLLQLMNSYDGCFLLCCDRN